MSIDSVARTAVAVIFGLALAGCGGGGDADSDVAPINAGVGEADVAADAGPPPDAPATIADLFPEGEGKQIVLSNCTSCHAVACAAIGSRPAPRWDDLREAHGEHVPSLSDEERTTAFDYLAANFSDEQPEPYVPPQFLERGCTPF